MSNEQLEVNAQDHAEVIFGHRRPTHPNNSVLNNKEMFDRVETSKVHGTIVSGPRMHRHGYIYHWFIPDLGPIA